MCVFIRIRFIAKRCGAWVKPMRMKKMARKTFVLLLILMGYYSSAVACQCAKSIGSNFLNQVKRFDLIVLGTFHIDNQGVNTTLEVEKLYKGQTRNRTIVLIPGGIDCNHSLSFKEGQRILIGLNKSPYLGQPGGFVARGCITSILYVTNGQVTTGDPIQSLPALGRARIGLLSKTMKLRKIEKRIRTR